MGRVVRADVAGLIDDVGVEAHDGDLVGEALQALMEVRDALRVHLVIVPEEPYPRFAGDARRRGSSDR